MVSIWRSSILVGVAAGSAVFGSMVVARPPTPSPSPQNDPTCIDATIVKGGDGKVPYDIYRMYLPWQEVEGAWQGRWTLVGDRLGHYTGVWRTGRVGDIGDTADLQVTITGDTVSVLRTQPKGTCHYTGRKIGDGWRVSGTYTCSWAGRPMPWSAAIGPGHDPAPMPPCSAPRDPRLSVIWRENEGVWRGIWEPRGDTGPYAARWTHDTESASASLQIEIRPDNNVVVLRSQAEGNCHYSGRLGPTGWTVSGNYYCDWQPVPRVMQPWSAVMGTGRAPGS